MISQGDYEYLKQRLLEDEQLTFYYIVRLIAATGVRVSELVEFNCEDVAHGYRNIISKGNKIRRVYIPSGLQIRLKDWLSNEGRKKGPLFLNHSGCRMSVSGVRKQLMDLTQELYIPIHCATGLPKILLKAAEIFLFYPIFLDMKALKLPEFICGGPALSRRGFSIRS